MAAVNAVVSAGERTKMADKLVRFSEQLCSQVLPEDRARPAQTVLSAAFIEWAVADNPGLTDFSDLLFAVEASLTDYDAAVHSYYAKECNKGGPRGQVVSTAMQALETSGEDAVKVAAADAYEAVLSYMKAHGLVRKLN